MTKKWSGTKSEPLKTKRQASKETRVTGLREVSGALISESPLTAAWREYEENQKLNQNSTGSVAQHDQVILLKRAFRAGWEARNKS